MDRLSFPQNCLDVVAQFLIGLVINEELDIDEAYEIVVNAWSYRNFAYDDFIEVLDLLEDERRIWVDWEENTFGKRGYSRMIYYTNIGTIAPDNSYLVFNAEIHPRKVVLLLRGQLADQRRHSPRWLDLPRQHHPRHACQRQQRHGIPSDRAFLIR